MRARTETCAHCDPPSVRARTDGGVALPQGFDAWFTRATALDPAHRFGSATDAVRALAQACGVDLPSGSEVPAPPPPRAHVAPTTVVSADVQVGRARRAALALIAGAAVMAAGGGLAWRAAKTRAHPRPPVVIDAGSTDTIRAAPSPVAAMSPLAPLPVPPVEQRPRKRTHRPLVRAAAAPASASATPVPAIPIYLYSRQ